MKNGYFENVGMMYNWKMKKRNTSKFVDAGSNIWNEKEGNKQHGMDREERIEKENKSSGTE